MAEPHTSRSRSLGGCATCRSRHVKCDEGRPHCSVCTYFGLICGGYGKNIFFDSTSTSDDGTIRFRRPLLTEEERKSMTEWLTSTVPPEKALRILSQIDEACENAVAAYDIEVQHGPFGVFRVSQGDSSLTFDSLIEESHNAPLSQDLVPSNDDYHVEQEAALSPFTQALLQSMFEESEQIAASPSMQFFNGSTDTGRIQEIFDDMSLPEIQDFSVPLPRTQSYQFPTYFTEAQFNQQLSPPDTASSLSRTSHNLPPDSVLLIEHYATTVINSLTPFRHTKTPWHVLFLPMAKNCLAAFMLGEKLDHASLTVFYGTLSISAFSLGGFNRSQTWLQRGRTYKQEAGEHVKLMLKTSYNIPKVAKYKNILMALITMVQVFMLSGNRDQTECYLLEAEKFIRLRGLNRHKSRKVRLLHHCYAFTRILHESTFTRGIDSSQRHHVREAVESSGLVVFGQDRVSFRLMGWNNLDEEMLRIRSQEDGENDLHLERPGLHFTTMYPEIYGVPEEWVFLLSQVVRLGNEKDAAEQQAQIDSLSLKEFTRRAKAIEKWINQLQCPRQTEGPSIDFGSQGDQPLVAVMLDGMHSALAIYFYRRIYDMNASMLQQKVKKVLDCLYSVEQADPSMAHGSSGLIWAAFIAGCEAEDTEIQNSFSSWFKKCAQQSGMLSFSKTLDDVEQVWQEKRNAGTNVTWLDLTRKNSIIPGHL